MKKIMNKAFQYIWACVSFSIGLYFKDTYELGWKFLLIVMLLLMVGDFLEYIFIKVKNKVKKQVSL